MSLREILGCGRSGRVGGGGGVGRPVCGGAEGIQVGEIVCGSKESCMDTRLGGEDVVDREVVLG